ncbi:MAG TPA: class I SAM-dependent methyltransferase [Dongiaceae bacterium]|nr:class I SAM-dependent methyltransferase [Dongiaceae bacterium]
MSPPERTRTAARRLMPWWAMDPESASLGRRSAMALLNVWHAFTRARPERRYERRILKRMARGDLTNTLGIRIRDEADIRAAAERWLAVLVELGLRPDDLCVEYGCGSLWCAEPVIRHLQPGRFIGLDATDRFYELGRQRLGSLLTGKQVGLAVISRRTLREIAALKPALVYSHRVLHHVPRHALARYLRNIASLLSEETILVIENNRRYDAEDIRPHLPLHWRCRQKPFGLVITHRAGSPG